MPIRILPDEVASQIAAGEVVERPVSVVKELVENALDAGASHIQVTIEEAGQRLIEVADDGIGIHADELALAVTRHATSKLMSSEDLFQIATLGFRGEALASIGSVSRLTITSRTADSEMGARLIVDNGHPGDVQPIGCPVGTIVRVEDLFQNVPARLKFLKKDTTERRQIDQFLTRYALAYPSVRFQMDQEGRTGLQTSGFGDRREVLAALYGPDIAKQMLEVDTDYEDLKVFGFISPTSVTRGSRNSITFFVNGRAVQDASLVTALTQAYHTLLMVGRYPIAVLFLEIPPNKVDVNVHPTKAEVRYLDSGEVFSGVQRGVKRALLAYTPVPTINTQVRWGDQLPPPNISQRTAADIWQAGSERDALQAKLIEQDDRKTHQYASEGQKVLPQSGVPLLRLVGQVGSSYLVAEGPDGLYLIDQHAAHERVLFERFMAQRGENIPSQGLLEPETVTLSAEESSHLEEQLPAMHKLGFEIEPFGPNAFKVRAMPVVLLGSDPTAALRVVIEDFEEDEEPLKNELEAKLIARVCKRAAVKAGQVLSVDEQKALISDLENCQAPRTCPHGRPTMIHLSIDLLERQFGRRGAR